MNKVLFSHSFILFLFISSLYSMESQQELQEKLSQLTSQLQVLRSALNTLEKPILPLAQSTLPYELTHYITENVIPNSLRSTRENIYKVSYTRREQLGKQQVEPFKEIIQSIASFARTSKEYRAILSNSMYNKTIIKKLFKLVNPYLLNNLTLPKKLSQDPTVLGTIHNILYYISLLRNPDTSPEKTDKAIRYIVDAGVDPNFFVDNDRPLTKAIMKNLPDTINFLIANGADVNLKNLNRQLPFFIAFNESPELALTLLKNPNINIELIKNKFSNSRIPIFTFSNENLKFYEKIFYMLLDKGLSPNVELSFHPRALTLFNLFIASGYQDLSIPLIQKMLEMGADINIETIWVDRLYAYFTPIQYAQYIKDNPTENQGTRKKYEKLYELLKKYKEEHP